MACVSETSCPSVAVSGMAGACCSRPQTTISGSDDRSLDVCSLDRALHSCQLLRSVCRADDYVKSHADSARNRAAVAKPIQENAGWPGDGIAARDC